MSCQRRRMKAIKRRLWVTELMLKHQYKTRYMLGMQGTFADAIAAVEDDMRAYRSMQQIMFSIPRRSGHSEFMRTITRIGSGA